MLSLLLSAWLIAIDPILTRDAIIYLRAAEAYLRDGFFAGQQIFGRPFLPVCIAICHQLTGLSLAHAGLLLNSLFYALLCVAFVAIIRTMGGNRRVQILATIVILSQPLIGDYRSSIMRDPAFWACILLSFNALLLYSRRLSWQHQAQWFGWIIAATLFRFEGLFFAALAPLALLFTGERHSRLNTCLRLLVPQLLVIAALLLAVGVYQKVLSPGARLFPAIETYLQGLLTFPEQFEALTTRTGNALLKFTSREDASVAALAGLGAILVLNICRAICWPWVITLLWGWQRGLLAKVRPDDVKLINAHLIICLLYLALFTLLRQFVLERYASIFALFALLYVPFILDALWAGGRRKLARGAVIVLLVVMSADMLHNHDYRKAYIREAAQWLAGNTPSDASLLTNDRYIAYFSQRQMEWRRGKPAVYQFDASTLTENPELWLEVDYLAVAIKPRQLPAWQHFLQTYSLTELVVFDGGRMGRIVVVKNPQNSYPKASRSSAKQSRTRASDSAS